MTNPASPPRASVAPVLSSEALQHPPPPPSAAIRQWPCWVASSSHEKPSGHCPAMPVKQVCVHTLDPVAPKQMPLLHACGKSQASPTSPVGASQKHLPASHFWPLAHWVAASVHGAPFMTVALADAH